MSRLKVEASVTLEFTFDEEICSSIAAALRPEAQQASERFLKTNVEVEGDHLRLMMRSGDLVDLRAGVNSYFNMVRAASETLSSLNYIAPVSSPV
jgi:tRNA threonylcarbamoyladenosine modification (KEOPS) complex  Pcc1 subunit